jgi:hypothetical protein
VDCNWRRIAGCISQVLNSNCMNCCNGDALTLWSPKECAL